MVTKKKLVDLTQEELKKCGWIERIAYRDNSSWMMYNSEANDFSKIRRDYSEKYNEIDMTLGKKWFAMYIEEVGKIILIDIAKMDVGEGQREATEEIAEFTQRVIETDKVIFVVARKETSYFSLARLAAEGKIEILQDDELKENSELREMIFCKSREEDDLSEQKIKYSSVLSEFEKNKDEYKRKKNAVLKKCIERLEAELGKDKLRETIERD